MDDMDKGDARRLSPAKQHERRQQVAPTSAVRKTATLPSQ